MVGSGSAPGQIHPDPQRCIHGTRYICKRQSAKQQQQATTTTFLCDVQTASDHEVRHGQPARQLLPPRPLQRPHAEMGASGNFCYRISNAAGYQVKYRILV